MKGEGDEQKESPGITLFTGTRAFSARVIVPLGLSAVSARVTTEGFRPKTLMNFSYFAPSLVSGSCRVTCCLSPCAKRGYMGSVTVVCGAPSAGAAPPAWRQHMKSSGVGVARRSGFANRRLLARNRKRLLQGRRLHVRLSVLQLVFRKMRGDPRTPPRCVVATACCTFTEVQQVFSITTTPGCSQEAPQVDGRRSNH